MGIIHALGEIVVSIVGGILQLFVELATVIGKKDHSYKARFGSKKKVFTYDKNASFYVGLDAIDQHIAMNSSLVIGRTGSGKSAMIFKPSFLQAPDPKNEESDGASMSYVVLDPAGELARDSAGWLSGQGYDIEIINFSESANSTVSWNPIAHLTDSGVSRFASEFIETALRTSGSSDPFWGISAQRALRLAINIVRLFPGYTNLYNVRSIVQLMSGDSDLLDHLMALPIVPHVIFEEYASIKGMGEKLRSSVLATTLASLELFSDSEIAKVSSESTLNLESYRSQSKVLFIQTKVMDQEHTSVLNTLLFSAFFSYCMRNIPEDDENTVMFAIDECSSLRMKPSLLPLAVSNLRKHRAFGVFGFQSLAQIEELYGKEHARTIAQNVGTKLFFGHQDLPTSDELSRMLGKYSYREEEGGVRERDLLSPDEVSFLEHKNGALLFSGSERGILLKSITPYHKSVKLRRRSNITLPDLKKIDPQMPGLLPIEDIIRKYS